MANIPDSWSTHDYCFPLDNSAVFTAAVFRRSSPSIFRISCELDEIIYLPDLQAALVAVSDRFPFVLTGLRRGVFWYYLDPIQKPLRLYADSQYPVRYRHSMRGGNYLFRVCVSGSRIACEFHHVLTDGTGALEFLKALIATYLTRRGIVCADWGNIKKPGTEIKPEELADAYAGVCDKKNPLPDPYPPAFHLPGKRYHGREYRVVTGTLPLSTSLAVAKQYGVSLTVLFAAVYIAALQDVYEVEACKNSRSTRLMRPICLQIPVNMRRFHPSSTLRNFFLFTSVSFDTRQGHFEFREILDRVHYLLKLNLTGRELDRQMRRNVRGEEYIFSRIVPLVIKNLVLRIVGRFADDAPFSGALSNLQQVSMPKTFADHINRFDFILPRKKIPGTNIAMISWRDTLSISVGSYIADRSFERCFFTRCVELGIPVTVESNL